MAAAGGGAGYVRLQTPESGISQATQFWGAQEAKRVGDKKLADERQGVRDDEALKNWEDTYNVKAGDFESKYTGFKSFDDMATDFSLDTTSQYVEMQRQAKEAMLSGNTAEKSRLQGEMIKIKGAFKEASKSQPALAALMTAFQKAAGEGKVSGASKDFEDTMMAGFQDMNMALRYKDGQLVYTGRTKDGKIMIIPQQDIMDGSFTWIEKQDLNGEKGIIKNLVKNLGTITKDSYSGYTKTTSQVWDEKLHGKAADLAIDALVGTDDVMADLLYQVTKGKEVKRKGFTDKDYETVKNSLKDQVKGGYTESVKKDFESGKYGTDVNAALTRQKMADDKNKPKERTAKETELGARRYNISEIAKGDTSFFSSGTFTYGDDTYVAKGASIIGNNIVIQTDGKAVKVPLNNETAINNLLNSFEGKTTTFDEVMSVDPYEWRESRGASKLTGITQLLEGQYDQNNNFTGEETPFVAQLKKLYPDATIEESKWGTNAVTVNGVEINLDTKGQLDVEESLRSALKEPVYKEKSSKQEKLKW